MRQAIPLYATLALTMLVACKPAEEQLPEGAVIVAVHDMTADFASYRTYDVVEPNDIPAAETAPRSYLESNRIAVIQSIIREMEARGYVRDQADPDLLLSPLIRLDQAEVLVEQAYWDAYYYGWYWGYAYPWYDQDVVVLGAGTLIIDAVDVGERENVEDDVLVFRGYAEAILPTQPTDVSEQISDAVAQIFNYWPSVTQ